MIAKLISLYLMIANLILVNLSLARLIDSNHYMETRKKKPKCDYTSLSPQQNLRIDLTIQLLIRALRVLISGWHEKCYKEIYRRLMILNIHTSTEKLMLDDFEKEAGECRTVLMRKEIYPGSHQRAKERLVVISASVEELKKQMAQPNRHAMLIEGVNPETGADYITQVNDFKKQFPSPNQH
jgi:hypothetical protein